VYGSSGTLEVVGSSGSNLALKFKEGVSYRHSGSATNVFWHAHSTSTGGIEVVSGKISFRNGAGWTNVSSVKISGSGVIAIADALSAETAFGPESGRSAATLEFPDGEGTLEIASGTATVRKLKIGDRLLPVGTYDKTSLPGRITGEGSVKVLRGGVRTVIVVR
jgi:hypothetical protein